MSLRILSILILVSCAFLKANAEIPIGINLRPYVEFSENRKYFAVAMPKGFNDSNGYTAVFKTANRELQFKIDSIVDFSFKVSNDGKRLIASIHEVELEKINWSLLVFNAQETKSYFLFQTDLKKMDDGSVWYANPQWQLFNDHILMTHEEKGYRISLPDFKVKRVKASKIQFPERNHEQEESNFEEVFGVYQLQGKDSTFLKTELLIFLNAEEVIERKLADKYLFVKFVLKEDGTFGDIKVFSQFLKTQYGSLDEEQMENIKIFLEHYPFAGNAVPKGVSYWYYSGPMLFVNKP